MKKSKPSHSDKLKLAGVKDISDTHKAIIIPDNEDGVMKMVPKNVTVLKIELTKNELIAKFMGMTYVNKHGGYWEDDVAVYTKHSLHYDTSLDRLMPVVRKIEQMGLCTNLNYNPDTKVKYFSIYDSEYRNTAKGKQFYAEGDNCIFDAVVKFVKWHDEKQPK